MPRTIIFRNGDYYFTDTNEVVPQELREGFRNSIFKMPNIRIVTPEDISSFHQSMKIHIAGALRLELEKEKSNL